MSDNDSMTTEPQIIHMHEKANAKTKIDRQRGNESGWQGSYKYSK